MLPDFITQHIDRFSGDDDTLDQDAGGFGMTSLNIPQPRLPQGENGDTIEEPISRNSLCPCGSGKKYKHCHGQLA